MGIGWGFVKKWVVFGDGVGEFCFGNVVFGAWGWGWKGWLFCCWMGVNMRIVSGLCVVAGWKKYLFEKKVKKSVLCEKKCVHLRSYSA